MIDDDSSTLLVAADMSQLELRISAYMSRDEIMMDILRSGRDMHSVTAAAIYGVDEHRCKRGCEHIESSDGRPGVTDAMRGTAKVVNYLTSYGGKAGKMIEGIEKMVLEHPEMGLAVPTLAEAQFALKTHRRLYSQYWRWVGWTIIRCREKGYSETAFGRPRFIPDIDHPDDGKRSEAERQAVNHCIQGCLPATTRILTRRGWRRIGDFVEGEVWTGGEWAHATKIDRGLADGRTLYLSDGRTFSCDARHEILVQDGAWPRWVNVDHAVGLPLVRDCESDWGEPSDPESWYWTGRMIGDGHLNKVGWGCTFGHSEKIAADRFAAWLTKQGFTGKTNSVMGFALRYDKRGNMQVSGYTHAGRQFWERRGLVPSAGARGKRIPYTVFQLDRICRQSFFDGYYDADGHEGVRSRKLTSVNPDLLADTLRLMQTIGMTGKISSPMKNGRGLVWYDLYIHATPHPLLIKRIEVAPRERMFTLAVDHPRHAFSSEGLISKNTAADLMKMAMVNIARDENMSRVGEMVLQVHDEIVSIVERSSVAWYKDRIRQHMELQQPFAPFVELVVDVEEGFTWKACHK